MTEAKLPGFELSTKAWEQREQFLRRFEEDWQQGRRPVLDDYLPAEGPERFAALVELAHTDLEWRLGAGEPARVEAYLERYPELAGDREQALALIAGSSTCAAAGNRNCRSTSIWTASPSSARSCCARPG